MNADALSRLNRNDNTNSIRFNDGTGINTCSCFTLQYINTSYEIDMEAINYQYLSEGVGNIEC